MRFKREIERHENRIAFDENIDEVLDRKLQKYGSKVRAFFVKIF